MSRLEQALKRAAGVLNAEADFPEGHEEGAEDALHRYAHEMRSAGPAAAEAAVPLRHRASQAPRDEKRPLGEFHPAAGFAGAAVDAVVPIRPHTIAPPRIEEKRQLRLHPAVERKLVVSKNAPQMAVEQYRRLAGALRQLQTEQGLKTLMVTSALPGEGKTLTIVNLALTLSEFCEQRVLLIDADLRRPFVHEAFQLSNVRGLSHVLSSESANVPFLQVSEHLTVLPAGRLEEPMDLTSDRMRLLLEEFAAAFDWVLVDVPPVGFMPDAEVLARLTGAVIFVIAANSTPHSLISRSIAALDPHRIIGTVLNCVTEESLPAAYYYRHYYATDGGGD